jgi:hypothetical protein
MLQGVRYEMARDSRRQHADVMLKTKDMSPASANVMVRLVRKVSRPTVLASGFRAGSSSSTKFRRCSRFGRAARCWEIPPKNSRYGRVPGGNAKGRVSGT